MSADQSVPQETPAETARRLQREVSELSRRLNGKARELPMIDASLYASMLHAIRHLDQASNSLAMAGRQIHAAGVWALLEQEVGS